MSTVFIAERDGDFTDRNTWRGCVKPFGVRNGVVVRPTERVMSEQEGGLLIEIDAPTIAHDINIVVGQACVEVGKNPALAKAMRQISSALETFLIESSNGS
jgi:hypothetical protein